MIVVVEKLFWGHEIVTFFPEIVFERAFLPKNITNWCVFLVKNLI